MRGELTVDFGSLPDWVTAAAAIFALVFARAAARAAQSTNDQQAGQLAQLEKAEKRRDESDLRRQAEKFGVWVTIVREEGYKPAIRIVNANTVPLYDCMLYCLTPMGVVPFILNVIEPSGQPRIIQRFTQAVRKKFEPDLGDVNFVELMDNKLLSVAGTFRDALGQWWYWAPSGYLLHGESKCAVEALCAKDVQIPELATPAR